MKGEMGTNQRCQRIYVVLFLLVIVCICLVSIMQREKMVKYNPFHISNRYTRMLKSYNQEKEPLMNSSRILVNTKERLSFFLTGAIFNEKGLAGYVSVPLESGLLHSFSPELEKSAAKRLLDPIKDQIFYANSPAIAWHQGKLVLVARIWLDKEIYQKRKRWPVNDFADNYLFTQSFDQHLLPLDSGEFLGVAAPKQFDVGDGPIEPRLFKVGQKLFASFNIAMSLNSTCTVDVTCFWDFQLNKPIIPHIIGGNQMLRNSRESVPRDKHWMPFTVQEQLYFVKNLDPLLVLQCNIDGSCSLVHTEDKYHTFNYHPFNHHLRGGTSFEVYRWPYYIGVTHTTLFKKNNHRYYTANIVVFHVDPYRVVYLSDPIQIHQDVYAATPMVRPLYITDNFIFPVSIILEDPDSLVVGAHANDHSSMLFRIKGIRKLMDSVIADDQKNMPKRGPPVQFLQNYVYQRTENLTNIVFLKKSSK